MYVIALMVGCSKQVATVGPGDVVYDVASDSWRPIRSVNGYGFVTLGSTEEVAGEHARHCGQIRAKGGY